MARKPAQAERLKVPRKFDRVPVKCAAILGLTSRNTHSRIKANLFQIAQGGCGVTTDAELFIGEECLVWATGGGHKYLGVAGKVVWMRSVYEGHEIRVVGIEFDEPLKLTPELLARLGAEEKK